MIRALGFSQTSDFRPFKPGRLCRGRERWITPWDAENPDEVTDLARLVVTGATFDDDSARDAMRGLSTAGVNATDLIAELFPDQRLMVFVEDGHPADIPDEAFGVELYDGHRAGGRIDLPLVRWYKVIDSTEALSALADQLLLERISGFALIDKDTDLEALWEKLFLLVGMSTMDSPPARYNPAAFPEILEICPAVVILHRDKHGPVLGVYSNEPIEGADQVLKMFADQVECLLVPICDSADAGSLGPRAIRTPTGLGDRVRGALPGAALRVPIALGVAPAPSQARQRAAPNRRRRRANSGAPNSGSPGR